MTILPKVPFAVKQRLLKHLPSCGTTGLKTRLLIIINLLEGRAPLQVAHVLKIHRDTVCASPNASDSGARSDCSTAAATTGPAN